MGVLNVTPDSFSDGGDHLDTGKAIAAGLRMVSEGALVIDVGGESTRPGAAAVDLLEERRRVEPVVAGLVNEGVVVSIDTRNPSVAEAALDRGASIVNDISGLTSPSMRRVVAAAGAAAVIMHMQGQPQTMQVAPAYDDVVAEVSQFLFSAAVRAVDDGVPAVMIDPGFGFGKSAEHNLGLVTRLAALTNGPWPVLLGASRKGTIQKLSGESDPKQRLPGTLALHLRASSEGAAMLRVHDVAQHAQALAVWRAMELVHQTA